MTRSAIAFLLAVGIGLGSIVVGSWLAWALPGAFITAGLAVIVLAALTLVEV